MSVAREKVLGAVKLLRVPADLCWGKPVEFVKRLSEMLTVELSVHPQNDFVVVGHQVPSEDDKNRLWIRLSRDGTFLGFQLFQRGKWRRIHNYRNDEIVWLHGDSRNIPEGWELIDENTGSMHSTVRTHVVGQYLANTDASETSKVYRYFAVRWIGF